MLSFLGFGKKTEAPIGYNKGKVSEVTNVSSSPVQVPRLLNDASNEVEDGNGSPGCRMSTADAPSSPSYLISGLNLEDTVSEPLHSARSVESNASRRSTSSRRSVNSKARGGDQSTKLTARSAIPEGDEEGKPSEFSWDDLRGMTMDHRRKTIDIWRLTSMPRKEFWEERRKRFEGVPLDPIKKQSDSKKDSHDQKDFHLPGSPPAARLAAAFSAPPMPPNTAGVSASPAAAVVAMQAPIQVQEMPQTAQQRNEAISRKVSLFRKSYGAQEVARLKQTLQMQSRVRREQAHLYEVTSTGKRKPAIPRPPEPPEMEQNRFTH